MYFAKSDYISMIDPAQFDARFSFYGKPLMNSRLLYGLG